MSVTTNPQEAHHFHRSMDQQLNHSHRPPLGKSRNHFSRDDRQLHKKRKSTNGYPFPDSRGPPPRVYAQQQPNSYSHDQNYAPVELNFPQMQLPFQQLPFGALSAPMTSFPPQNLQLGNPPVLNEGLFGGYQLPNQPQPNQPQPNHLSQSHLQHHISPLGIDIGSIPNLTHLISQSNETSQLHGQAMNRQIVLEQLKAQELLQQQQLLKMFPPKKEDAAQSVTSALEKKPNHHDILRQHNEEYKMKQMKKAAVHQASTRYGHYVPQDSAHFNFIVPSLPWYLLDGQEENQAPKEDPM